ncbi:MAG: hypothetical protein A2504_10025 [Bdellovibrionales bacterium RIFOXYD12_FULL_39_22]|nr:MAG: hypothetical protein A2385_17660 [Bdellovibrionales bacterium RIFOXYB1_FULL_39_21]OFZ43947.1 MAG: hypothetical protein A2485_04330 [Bdellovibrionales bacterium RIFOXYC12_FULL_39_17]OFZ48319.1 MAG: hypothetical protein A2404_01745 [Bdellovibrionales bacterium RIFOXYC1_FULL_39_130]OFZ94910.1 MAG: hypothetical protein A2504_10025 [Bdellovibrionales bacterium RIFOXYD12_FULL_39_22]HLE12668.1 hypothetical protein [Bacteriovoracaceae bacterium]
MKQCIALTLFILFSTTAYSSYESPVDKYKSSYGLYLTGFYSLNSPDKNIHTGATFSELGYGIDYDYRFLNFKSVAFTFNPMLKMVKFNDTGKWPGQTNYIMSFNIGCYLGKGFLSYKMGFGYAMNSLDRNRGFSAFMEWIIWPPLIIRVYANALQQDPRAGVGGLDFGWRFFY